MPCTSKTSARRLGLDALDLGAGRAHPQELLQRAPGRGLQDNERLEFLGDAVVDLAISHRLMERFPGADEGELSKLRALHRQRGGPRPHRPRSWASGELLLLGRGEELTGGRDKSSVLADALEAVIGAVYLGVGHAEAVMALVDRLFGDALEGVAEGRSGVDCKTRLQEDVQTRLKLSPRYRVVSEAGPGPREDLRGGGAPSAPSCTPAPPGRSKKEAEQAAAARR